ncbi:MAG: hypothetical protein JNK15_05780, partial [Planctomycetes bacterium]|nr:hypothetical protein [Planctomycetota bacterium]
MAGHDTAAMLVSRPSWWANPSTWYGLFGVLLIAATLWLPWASAARSVRIEGRAARIAELMLATVQPLPLPQTAAELDHLQARLDLVLHADGVFVGDLVQQPDPPPGVVAWFANKHYAFQIAVSPPDARETPGRGSEPAYEVLAWPLEPTGPAHSAWLFAENAPKAYTRNLAADYHGFGSERPLPGAAQRLAQG